MFYKITNKDSELYKTLYELRTGELEIEKQNKEAVHRLVGDDWTCFVGYNGQQNHFRCTQYHGFEFKHPENLPPKTWKLDPKFADKGVYIPDKRTKNGRRIAEALNNLPHSSIIKVFSILECELNGCFAYPYIEICENGAIVVYMSDKYDLENKFADLTEITQKEFYKLQEGGAE